MSSSLRRLALLNVGLRSSSGELAYHLAHKLVDLGHRVLIVDFDPEAGATEKFLGDKGLFDAWANDDPSFDPIAVSERLFLIPGDPRLARLRFSSQPIGEDDLRERIDEAAQHNECSWVLLSVGMSDVRWSNFALTFVSGVAVVVGSQPRSLRALAVAGDLFLKARSYIPETVVPPSLLGYMVQHPLQKVFGPAEIYAACLARLPAAFRTAFGLRSRAVPRRPIEDSFCLGLIGRPAGLFELANDVGKPAFQLRPADGASESLLHAALEIDAAYMKLAEALELRFAVTSGS